MQPLYLKQSKLYDPKTIEEIVKLTEEWNTSAPSPAGPSIPQPDAAPYKSLICLHSFIIKIKGSFQGLNNRKDPAHVCRVKKWMTARSSG